MPVTTLDPDAMRYAEIGRQADLSRTPIQFAKPFEAGVAAGNSLDGIRLDKEKRQKAAHFQSILDAGLPAMQDAWGQLAPEQKQRVPDPSLFTDSRDASVSWWQLLTETHGQQLAGSALAAGNYDQAAGAVASAGLTKDPTSLIDNARTEGAKSKVLQDNAAEKAKKDTLFESFRKDASKVITEKGGKLKNEDITMLADKFPTDLSGYEPAEKWFDNLKNQAQPNPFAQANHDLNSQGQLFQQEESLRDDFLQETKSFQPVLTSFSKTAAAIKQNNPADAYAAVINFVKTLDQGSTVREGEKLTAENSAAGGKWEAFKKWANQVADGKLTDEVRINLYNSALQLISAERSGYNRVRGKYQRILSDYAKNGFKFNETRILGGGDEEIDKIINQEIPGITPPKPAAATAPKGPRKIGRFQVEVHD